MDAHTHVAVGLRQSQLVSDLETWTNISPWGDVSSGPQSGKAVPSTAMSLLSQALHFHISIKYIFTNQFITLGNRGVSPGAIIMWDGEVPQAAVCARLYYQSFILWLICWAKTRDVSQARCDISVYAIKLSKAQRLTFNCPHSYHISWWSLDLGQPGPQVSDTAQDLVRG